MKTLDYAVLCKSDNNNCTVQAISKALNVSMEEAYMAMEEQGRKHGSGAQMYQVKWAVEALGGSIEEIKHCVLNLEIKHRHTMTVNNICEYLWEGRYIMATMTHAYAMLHGTVDDWCADTKSQIYTVYKIVGGVR